MTTKDLQQSPNMGGTGKPGSSPQQWFISEIQQMMHGLGDCRKPLHESAVLVEEITQQQMAALMLKAADVATMRGSKLIGAEDILFLLRKDKVKLHRLLRYMDKKDQKASAVRSASVDEDESSLDACLGESKTGQPQGKRRKMCYDFLQSIDQTGELLDLFDDEEEDEIKYERLLRAELRSRCLDHQQYLDYSEARQANFGRRYKSQRFRDWLTMGVNIELKPNVPALEIMSYMAYETVAQIVDLALLVKQDMQSATSDPVRAMVPSVAYSWSDASAATSSAAAAAANAGGANAGGPQKFPGLTSPTVSPPSTPVSGQTTPTANPSVSQLMSANSKSKSKKKKKPQVPVSVETPQTATIQPSDIQEAWRRYTQFIGPFSVFGFYSAGACLRRDTSVCYHITIRHTGGLEEIHTVYRTLCCTDEGQHTYLDKNASVVLLIH